MIFRLTIYFSIFLSSIGALRSQNSFTITLKDSTYDNRVNDAIELSNGQFIIVGMRILQPDSLTANLVKLDAYGNLIRQHILRLNGNSSAFFSIIKISENRFVLSGMTYLGASANLWLCTIDSALNVIAQKRYILGTYSLSYNKMKLDYQNNILVFGIIDSLNTHYSFIFKLTSELDSISCRIYNQNWSEEQDLTERSDHKGCYFLVNGFGSTGSGKVLSLDTDFNIDKITELTDGIGYHGTIKLLDSTHIIVCGERAPTGNMSQSIAVQLYDTNFNLIHYSCYGKTDTVELPALFKSVDFSNPFSIFIGGTSNFFFYEFVEADNWYMLNNIDTAFNLKWERFYGGDGYYDLYGILTTHDRGCLMYGTLWDYHNNPNFTRYLRLIKVSKDGLLSDENGRPVNKTREVTLYPNPGTDKIVVESALKNLVVSFFDITGNCVLVREIKTRIESLNVSGLSAGIYFYRFTSGDKVIESGKWIKE
jgi:hypothetical protein